MQGPKAGNAIWILTSNEKVSSLVCFILINKLSQIYRYINTRADRKKENGFCANSWVYARPSYVYTNLHNSKPNSVTDEIFRSQKNEYYAVKKYFAVLEFRNNLHISTTGRWLLPNTERHTQCHLWTLRELLWEVCVIYE